MAGAMLTDLNVINNLQIEYGKRLEEQLNRRVFLWNTLPKSSAPMSGLVHKDLAVIGYPASAGTVGWERPLQSSDRSKTAVTSIWDCFYVGPISISWASIAKSGGEAAYVPQLSMEMQNLRHFMELDFERMLFGDGSGKICHISVVPTSGSYVPTASTWKFSCPWWQASRIHRGHRFLIYSDGSTVGEISESSTLRGYPSGAGYFEVSGVRPGYTISTSSVESADAAYAVVTLTGAAPIGHAIEANDVVVKYTSVINAAISGTYNAGTEFMGLKGIISKTAPPLRSHTFDTYPSASTFQGIDPTSNDWWQSQEVAAAGAEIDDTHFDQLDEQFENYGSVSPDEIKEYIANPRQKRILLRARYGGIRVPVSGGDAPDVPVGQNSTMSESKTIKVNSKPFKTHRYCDADVVYARSSYIYRYENKAVGFDKPNLAQGWHQNFDRLPMSDNEAWGIMNVGTTRRNAMGKISGLATT